VRAPSWAPRRRVARESLGRRRERRRACAAVRAAVCAGGGDVIGGGGVRGAVSGEARPEGLCLDRLPLSLSSQPKGDLCMGSAF
jgi:hypothetical protein